ncbi:MAG: hypothetical protein CVV27_19760 [Candidatus Melainabacteria bacterium HGW-Melainabacteria-1]|nr:MAG: hypothetical protein CVV27_19760 [Candidatus Melainabacteria bacterium HGW-Melainabacteria-1]
MSYNLNPIPVKYAQLVAHAQDQIFDQVNAHYKNALPALGNSIRNMRYALEIEDFSSLHREYLELKAQEDVAFFMQHDYEGYLPTRMQQVLRDVERELKAQGYVI